MAPRLTPSIKQIAQQSRVSLRTRDDMPRPVAFGLARPPRARGGGAAAGAGAAAGGHARGEEEEDVHVPVEDEDELRVAQHEAQLQRPADCCRHAEPPLVWLVGRWQRAAQEAEGDDALQCGEARRPLVAAVPRVQTEPVERGRDVGRRHHCPAWKRAVIRVQPVVDLQSLVELQEHH